MLLERYYDDSLAQASYLIGCERSREAIIIDPNRDVDRYIQAAAAHRMRIAYVTETHIHADYLSASAQLAAMIPGQDGHDAPRLLLSAYGGEDWSYRYGARVGARMLNNGDELDVGSVRLRVLHTPGHTPEHICFLVTDTATGDTPIGLVSGDFLFVGDVGRPDLLERSAKAANTMAHSARELYRSLQRLADLPDYLQVWPGHGAGSACGKALGSVPQTTLGYERLYNPALQHRTEDAFVKWVLADQPEPPPYFATMKEWNRDGPPEIWPERLHELSLTDLDQAVVNDPWVVDVRRPQEFARGHYPGSINIPASKSLPTYAGTVLSYDRPIIVAARSEEQAYAVRKQLQLIGLDIVTGWVPLASIALANDNVVTPQMEPRVLAERLFAGKSIRVIDVRGTSEWNEAHIEGAEHIYLGDLMARMEDARKDERIVVHCESGSRSSIAASLLQSRGFKNVANLAGGLSAWRKAKLPVIEPQP
jgi:hydroxyacylglutathione hydrolase